MTAEEVQKFPYYAKWLASNTPSIKADKTHRLSGYAIFSYSYGSLFSLSANTRFDASTSSVAQHEKFLPVWSASGMLNLKELALRPYDVVSDFRFRTSFGKTGNMVDNQTPNLLLRQESVDTYYGENTAKVFALPNPNLRWEQTDQFNAGLTSRSSTIASRSASMVTTNIRAMLSTTRPCRRSTARTTM